jgi:peptide subunit release factor 1 (eRF1)
MTVTEAARRLVERQPAHRMISLYLDLDPERFATAPARSSQITSLIDQALREVDGDPTLEHEDTISLRLDLDRIRRYLHSREPPFKGARALAVFCSGRDDLFEVVQLSRPVPGRVEIGSAPLVEPLLAAAPEQRWCVALVSRGDARILSGAADRLTERERLDEDVHGQHDQGGWSQARYERSVEEDTDAHLRRVVDDVARLWRRERFDRLALGGPQEVVARFESLLPDGLRSRLTSERVSVDVSTATEEQIREVVAQVVDDFERRRERELLDQLAERLGAGGRAAGGPEAVLQALTERRVGTLLLEDRLELGGGRCPTCGLLTLERQGECPADGSELETVDDLREATIEAAIAQDAEVVIVRSHPDLGPFRGIAALLRF